MSEAMRDLPHFELGAPGEQRDDLVDRVCRGVKTATSSLLRHWAADGEEPPRAGDRFALVDSSGPRGTVEVRSVSRLRLGEVDDRIAHAEGEDFVDAVAWRDAHERFWRTEDPSLIRPLDDDEIVVVEWFVMVE